MKTGDSTTLSAEPDTRIKRADLAYSQLVRDIEMGISSGAFNVGDRLPSEAELKLKYGISINSIRRGVAVLVQQGVLSRRHGSGTYVCGGLPFRQTVTADTVLMATVVQNVPTHPFFGERHRAMIQRFTKLGFRTESFVQDADLRDQQTAIWHPIDMSALGHRLATDRRLAGVVFDRPTVEEGVELAHGRVPCVSLVETDACPFVNYHWPEERWRALQLAVSAGARRILLFQAVGDQDPPDIKDGPQPLLGGAVVTLCQVPMTPRSRILYAAHDTATAAFRTRLSKTDAVVMSDDVVAQGVLDALAECAEPQAERLRLVALVNSESRLRTSFSFAALVADGAAAGNAVADLLHQQITEPDRAPESLYLRCAIRLAKGWPRTIGSSQV